MLPPMIDWTPMMKVLFAGIVGVLGWSIMNGKKKKGGGGKSSGGGNSSPSNDTPAQ